MVPGIFDGGSRSGSRQIVSVIYEEDEEAFEIWNKKMGIPAERISVLEKQTISGSMVPAHAVLVPRSIMTEGKNTDAAARIVR